MKPKQLPICPKCPGSAVTWAGHAYNCGQCGQLFLIDDNGRLIPARSMIPPYTPLRPDQVPEPVASALAPAKPTKKPAKKLFS